MTDTEVPEQSLLAIAKDWIDGVAPHATKFKRGVLLMEFRSYLDDDAQDELDREIARWMDPGIDPEIALDRGRAIADRAMGVRRSPALGTG